MKWSFLLLPLLLMGCDSAGPGFRGVAGVEREVLGSRFTLRHREGIVEAIRTNPEMLPKFDAIAYKAALAAEAETGCKTEWVEGDAAMMLLGMSCNGQKAPPKPKRRQTLYCDIDNLYTSSIGTSGSLTCFKS